MTRHERTLMPVTSEQASGYLQKLPALFSEAPFIGRYLLAFEQVLTGIAESESDPAKGLEEKVAEIHKLFDPNELLSLITAEEAFADFLPWLAGWVALNLRADWTKEQQKNFLAQIVPLYRYRGTKDNLIELLKIYTGLEPVITEAVEGMQIGVRSQIGVDTLLNGSPPHYFRIMVSLPNPSPEILLRQRQIVTALVDLQKPAHTHYDLDITFTTIQIGVRSTIGIDTLLGSIPLT